MMGKLAFSGSVLRELRDNNNLSAKELGLALGVDAQTVNLWEGEKRLPTMEHFSKLLLFFNEKYPNLGIDANLFFKKRKELKDLENGESLSFNQLKEILLDEVERLSVEDSYDAIHSIDPNFFRESGLLDLFYKKAKETKIRRLFLVDKHHEKDVVELSKEHRKEGIESKFIRKEEISIFFQLLDFCLFSFKKEKKGMLFFDIPFHKNFYSYVIFSRVQTDLDEAKGIFESLWNNKSAKYS